MRNLFCSVAVVAVSLVCVQTASAQGWVQRATGGRVSTPGFIQDVAPKGVSMSRPNPAHTASELKPMPNNSRPMLPGNSSHVKLPGPNSNVRAIVQQNNSKQQNQQQQEIIRSQQELINQKQTLINQKQAFIQQMQTQQQWNSQPQWNPNPPFGGQPQQQVPPGAAIASGILQIVGAGIQASQANGSR